MATTAKISLTCKLSEVPKHRELADKRIEFFLQDGESDRIFTVQMKPKLFKKLTDHGFADWVAAITGEIGPATETGFELVNASVQVFERKAREADTGAEAKPAAEPLSLNPSLLWLDQSKVLKLAKVRRKLLVGPSRRRARGYSMG